MSSLAAQYGEGAAKAAGAATVYYGIKGAAKLKDLLTQKDEPSKIVLPPGKRGVVIGAAVPVVAPVVTPFRVSPPRSLASPHG